MDKVKNIDFYLLGKIDNKDSSAISNKQIEKWQEEGYITYLGATDDVRGQIANADCIVLPTSYREGIPRVLLEAMAMQKPIITTNTTGCKETICNIKEINGISIGDNGILCEPKDPISLKNALEYFLNLSEEKVLQMGKAGKEYAKTFDIKRIIDAYKKKLDITKPTIAFVSNTSFGMINFRLEVLKELQKEGFIIHILSPQDEYSHYFDTEGFFYHPIHINSKGLNPFEDLKSFLQIKKILKSISPSMVFTYTIKPVIYASLACRILKIPHISVITGLGYVFVNGGMKKRLFQSFVSKMYQISLKNASEIWFLNTDDEKEFLKRGIASVSKTYLLHSEGINLEHFSPIPKTTQNKIIFLLIARMLWDKGINEFVQAAKMIKQ